MTYSTQCIFSFCIVVCIESAYFGIVVCFCFIDKSTDSIQCSVFFRTLGFYVSSCRDNISNVTRVRWNLGYRKKNRITVYPYVSWFWVSADLINSKDNDRTVVINSHLIISIMSLLWSQIIVHIKFIACHAFKDSFDTIIVSKQPWMIP